MRKWLLALTLVVVIAVAEAELKVANEHSLDADGEVSIAALRAKEITAQLSFEEHLYHREQISGDLYSYLSDGLKVYVLVNTPTIKMPNEGFPVLIYGHGFHPEPRNYGISGNGVVSRPGDYYRGIPERYAQEGYLVLTPDYRGHNISEGLEYTKRDSLSSSYYASDILHLIEAIASIKRANPEKLYYAGHSMGGDAGLKALLTTSRVSAASLWSPAVGSTAQRALYYGRLYDEDKRAPVDAQKMREYRNRIDQVYADLKILVSTEEVDALNHLENLSTPVIIHHARDDRSVPYQWSENLVVKLNALNKDFLFFTYDTDNHLFEGENLERAFLRDLDFFNTH